MDRITICPYRVLNGEIRPTEMQPDEGILVINNGNTYATRNRTTFDITENRIHPSSDVRVINMDETNVNPVVTINDNNTVLSTTETTQPSVISETYHIIVSIRPYMITKTIIYSDDEMKVIRIPVTDRWFNDKGRGPNSESPDNKNARLKRLFEERQQEIEDYNNEVVTCDLESDPPVLIRYTCDPSNNISTIIESIPLGPSLLQYVERIVLEPSMSRRSREILLSNVFREIETAIDEELSDDDSIDELAEQVADALSSMIMRRLSSVITIDTLEEDDNRDLARPFEDQETICAEFRHTKVDAPNTECGICFDMESNEQMIRLECKHVFHGPCVTPWVQKKGTCPTCRFECTPVYRMEEVD